MESAVCAALLLCFFFVPCSQDQGTMSGTTADSGTMQPWLVGLTAVVCFLCVIFVGTLINRFFCSKATEVTPEDNIELRTDPNVHDNIIVVAEEKSPRSAEWKAKDDKQPKM